MPLQPGTRIGSYEIVAPLAVGTTESYKATDVRINRTVTVKPFPSSTSHNSELLQRFVRESRLVATLKHPHICAILELLHEGEEKYLITEFLEGETLAERLKRGPLRVEEALGVAVNVAGALDKAHRQGVTHRGLNPSTIILTENGAKIVDFGFAMHSATAEPPLSASQLSTRTVSSLVGSVPPYAAPYMAPEQFDGQDADARSDIFAFGTILYEMLTSRPAFEGKTTAMVLAAVQTVEPEPVSKLQPATPPALEFIVKRCLAKDPNQRLQTARDLLNQLQWISEGGSGVIFRPATAGTRQKQNRALWIAAAALGLITVALAPSGFRYFRGMPESPAVRFMVPLPGTAVGTGGTPIAVSPDGRWIANARAGGNNGGVYLLSIGSVTPKFLFEGTSLFSPFWSPDSRSFGYFEDGKLKSSDVSGSPPQTISDAPSPTGGGTWSKDGVIVFASGGVLHRVPAAGGQPTPITTLDASLQETEHMAPNFLPDGRHYLYLSISAQPTNSAVYVGSLDSKERTRLFVSETPAIYAAPGYLLFNRATAVFAQPFDTNALKLTGEPIRLDDAALRGASGGQTSPALTKVAIISASQTGVLAYRKVTPGTGATSTVGGGFTLMWFDRTAQGTERVGGVAPYAGVDLAPDGKRFAVHLHEGEGGDSWFFDSGRMQRLTFSTAQDNSMPIWSRDGKKIAFGSKRNGKWGLYVKAADGTGAEELIFESDAVKAPMSWSSDDKTLVFCAVDPKTRGDIWMVPLQGDHKPAALIQTNADECLAHVSPDGRWIAYQSDETGTPQIYVRPFPEGSGNKAQISAEGAPAIWPRWSADSRHLYFVVAPNVLETDIKVTGSSIQPAVPRVLFPLFSNPNNLVHTAPYHRYAVSPDGQRFLFPQAPGGPNIVGGLAGTITQVVDQSAPGVSTSGNDSITVVLNWTRSLQRK